MAIIECPQEIPCNPCEAACPFGAIVVGQPITNCPRLIVDRCKGCGACIPACPGLAIFLVDETYQEDKVLVAFPYEYLPLPEKGQQVQVVNGEGREICPGEVIWVRNPERYDHSAVVAVSIERAFANEARGIVRLKGGGGSGCQIV
ncbi:MAG: 4Fe-4S binding protein [Firmicutes bacterium]|nr:4Fe-4S binding protein [Bacillota bacterium]